MAARNPHADRAIPDDMAFQRRMWAFERTGWVVFAIILFGAAIGLFGGGGWLASAASAADDDSIVVQFERFGRLAAPMRLQITARPATTEGAERVRIWLDRDYLAAFVITRITPPPAAVDSAPDRLVFEFPLVERGATATVLLDLEPRTRWRLIGRLGVEDGSALMFSQFIYP